jgi:hypothetical protein
MESMLEKLLQAGWISGTGTVQRKGRIHRGILWTDQGLTRTLAMAMFLEEVDLTDEELLCLRRVIGGQVLPHD